MTEKGPSWQNGPSFQDELRAAIRMHADWLLAALLAIFMAFIVGILKWTYDGIEFSYRNNILSLLGLWLLCFWAVWLARRLLTGPRP